MKANALNTVCIIALSAVNIFLLIRIAVSYKEQHDTKLKSYSYVGDDFPPIVPLHSPLPTVELTLEKSIRFALANDTLPAWHANLAASLGYIRLGPEHRLFTVATHHQQHCLFVLANVLAHPRPRVSGHGDAHLQHCLNYLRQTILCEADMTLEPSNWQEQAVSTQQRTGEGWTRTCRDWTMLREFVDENYREWMQFKREYFGVT